jgi:hypothetical protein
LSIATHPPEWFDSLTSEQLLRLFHSSDSLKTLGHWLTALHSDVAACENLAQSSAANNNGFIKIRLAKAAQSKPDLRLHIWPSGGRTATNIHTHPWDFSSLTLSGSLDHDIYRRAEGQSHDVFRYETKNEQDMRTYDMGKSDLELSMTVRTNPGSIVTYNRKTIHRIRKESESAAISLVVRQPYLANHSLIFQPRDAGAPPLEFRVPLAADLVQNYLREGAEMLQKLTIKNV